ncbi:MAG: hypothetical protein ABF820_08605 [Sporolactobacillus sp.]
MSEDVYVLKKAVNDDALKYLNQQCGYFFESESLWKAIGNLNTGWPELEQVEDMIAAIKSGKNIVNPLSPKEELKRYYNSFDSSDTDFKQYSDFPETAIEKTLTIIAKEHPDVATWLDGEA